MSGSRIVPIHNNTAVLAESGPMRLVIQCWRQNGVALQAAMAAGKVAFSFLEQVAMHRELLKQPAGNIDENPKNAIACKMVHSAKAIGDADLTPMAAVAGTLADAVADWLFERGMTRVIVDNGGDVAIRLAKGESARVGLRTDVRSQAIGYILCLDDRNQAWGINTSGLGGRSFTRGIATAVTAVANCSSMADAAATAIANACFVKDANIIQVPAERIAPDTDLRGIPVTVAVGSLSTAKINTALQNALCKAENLTQKGMIHGALVVAKGKIVVTADLTKKIAALEATA